MGDVQLVSTGRISKSSLGLGRGSPSSSDPPAFTLPPRNARVSPGGTARLDGKVRGSPDPQVCWYRNGQAVVAGDRLSMEQSSRGTFSLVLQNVQEEDAGRYTCEATNEAGSRQVTVEIIVEGNATKKYGLPSSSRTTGGRFGTPAVENRPSIWGESPPKFVTKPSRLFLRVGQTGKFSAKITGRPQPQVVWLKGEEELQASGHVNMFERSGIHFLEIREACPEDAGTYTCSVSNSAGKAMASAELNVQGSGTESSTRGASESSSSSSPKPAAPAAAATPAAAAAATPAADVPSTSHTSNGLPSDQQKTSRSQLEVSERKKSQSTTTTTVTVTKDTGDVTQTRAAEGRRALAPSPKLSASHTEPKDEGTRRVESPLKASAAIPASSMSSIQPGRGQQRSGTVADTQASRGSGRAGRSVGADAGVVASAGAGVGAGAAAGELRSPGRASGASSPSRPSRDALRLGRDIRAASPVGAAPRFELQPQSQDALEGTKVVFKCQASGSPVPTVSWLRDGLTVRSRPGLSLQQEGADVHLLCLDRAQRSDAGQYGCTATNARGKVSATWMLHVKSARAEGRVPVFSSLINGCTVTSGQDFTLQCSVEGRPVPTVSWLLDDKPCQHAQAVFERGLAQLTVKGALPDDAGAYTCVAENEHGRADCSAIVHVKEKPSAKRTKAVPVVDPSRPAAPVFLRGLEDLRVMDGSQVIMTVEMAGNPTPEVVWLHNGKEIQESEDFHFERNGNRCTLFIQEVFPEDTGKYTCEVWNEVGEARSEACLTVQEPQDGVQPWFITKPKSATASLGQHVLLSCAIAGDPFPEYAWVKDGQEVTAGADFDILQKEDVVSLLIRRVRLHHAGDYEICLKNKVGDCSCVATLLVSEGSSPGEDTERGEGGGGGGGGAGGGGAGASGGGSVGGVDRTSQFRGGGAREGPSSSNSSSSSVSRGGSRTEQQPQWRQKQKQQQQQKQQQGHPQYREQAEEEEEEEEEEASLEEEEEAGGAAGAVLLKRRVETREHREEQIRQQEAQQLDFRTVLGRKVNTKSVSEEDLKEITAEQMDFRGNLKGGQVTPKTQSEDERKGKAPQQVDFRSVLAKKPGGGPAGPTPPAAPPKPSAKGNPPVAPVANCVDGGGGGGGGDGKAPEFTQKLSDVTVVDGQRLRLECQLSGDASANVTWTLEGKTIKPSKFIVLANEGGKCSLTIDKALPEDEGQYTCRVENAAGKAECSCTVLVDDPADKNTSPADKKSKKPCAPTTENEARIKKPAPKTAPKQGIPPPQIQQFPDDMKILAGQPVEILCKFIGAQPITCTWLKFRKPIQMDNVLIETTDTSSRLYVPESQEEHCGCYTIEVRNGGGMRQAALNLTIVDKPDPPARVPIISDVGKTTLNLQWRGPSYDGGSAVQSYTLEIWDSVGKQWKDLASTPDTYYSVQKLTADREYKFRVKAINIYGTGEPSAETEPVTVGVEEEEPEEEPISDEENEKEPDYKTVSVRTDLNVKDLYNVEDRLGAGKFGTVFKLTEKATRKVWAGKFIKTYSEKERKEVRAEIGIMNDLHHPKLVQLVDAFEFDANMVMVLEMISGGELFERIIDEDFELSEREVIKYMLQIVDGVNFIHKQEIVHLDLKPENIMCVNKTGSKIKLIDFGLARRLANAGTLKVLFGTPEFVAPEVINYEPISYPTDMWSIGVICYILVSGLSPFMGDNDGETLANVTSATWDFEDEAFDDISDVAKDFISQLLKKDKSARLSCDQCLEHPWLKQDTKTMEAKKLSKERMKKYLLRRKWQKTGHALRAIGRLSNMAMMAGVHAKKGSHTEEDNQLLDASEADRTPVKPSFSSIIKDAEVVEGSAARFECKIDGFPDPEIVWFKDEQPIKETRHYQIDYDEEGNCTLVISEVCGDDDAKFTCKAMNSLGEATCTAELIVEVMGGGAEEEEEEEEE